MRFRASTRRALTVALALLLASCSDSPSPQPQPLPPSPPVTAEKILDVPDLQPANVVALSPDGSLVAVAGVDGAIVTLEVPSGAERSKIRVVPHSGPVDFLVFSADGSLLAAIAREYSVIVWDMSTGVDRGSAEGGGNTRAAAFHPTEATLVFPAGPNLIRFALQGERRESLPNAFAGEHIAGVALSDDGQFLAAVSEQGTFRVWTWPELTLRTSLKTSTPMEPTKPVSLVLARQATRAAANGLRGRLHVVDLAKERAGRTLESMGAGPRDRMHAEMRGVLAFTNDGEWLFAPDEHHGGVRIVHVATGTAYPVIRGDAPLYKAMSISVPASLVALLRPGDAQGRAPYGLEVWRLTYGYRLPERWTFVALGVPIPSESTYNPASPVRTESSARDACDKAVGRPEAHPPAEQQVIVQKYVACMKSHGWGPG